MFGQRNQHNSRNTSPPNFDQNDNFEDSQSIDGNEISRTESELNIEDCYAPVDDNKKNLASTVTFESAQKTLKHDFSLKTRSHKGFKLSQNRTQKLNGLGLRAGVDSSHKKYQKLQNRGKIDPMRSKL